MTTADWALVISILSAIVSLTSFVWNVWSKFIYPKPAVRVSLAMVQVVEPGSDYIPSVLRLGATNMGPGEVSLSNALTQFRGHSYQSEGFGLLSTLDNYPLHQDIERGYFGAGFPAKVAVGEQFSAYLYPAHERLAKGDYQRIGFTDSFGRNHWAPRQDILKALPYIREECEKAGINWRGSQRVTASRTCPPDLANSGVRLCTGLLPDTCARAKPFTKVNNSSDGARATARSASAGPPRSDHIR